MTKSTYFYITLQTDVQKKNFKYYSCTNPNLLSGCFGIVLYIGSDSPDNQLEGYHNFRRDQDTGHCCGVARF